MKKITLFTILLVFSLLLQAQRNQSSSSFMFAMGTNHFMGELGGGKNSPSAHFMGLRDLDLNSTRPTWQISYRYKFPGRKYDFLKYIALRANFTYALLSGHDKLSGNYARQGRNLTFRSPIYALNGHIEYYFIPEKSPSRHAMKSLGRTKNISAYIFTGFGAFYYYPKAKNEAGKWVALQPLGTEGQYANHTYTYTDPATGVSEELTTPDPYKRFAFNILLGIGMKYKIDRRWSIGLEFSNSYTSTDYLDDVSDRYFNYDEFGLSAPSSETAYFSDRHLTVDHDAEVVIGEPGAPYLSGKTMRGSPDFNDAYVLTLVTLYYTPKKKRRGGLPKHKRSW